MELSDLERQLLARAPADPEGAARWKRAVERFVYAATPIGGPAELDERLPPAPRFLGSGPWLDAIAEDYGHNRPV